MIYLLKEIAGFDERFITMWNTNDDTFTYHYYNLIISESADNGVSIRDLEKDIFIEGLDRITSVKTAQAWLTTGTEWYYRDLKNIIHNSETKLTFNELIDTVEFLKEYPALMNDDAGVLSMAALVCMREITQACLEDGRYEEAVSLREYQNSVKENNEEKG